MTDYIKRDNVIIAIKEHECDVLEHGYRQFPSKSLNEYIADIPSADVIEPKTKVIAQVTFDEEKLREIVKEAVERFKEEYEITDRPQGEWIIKPKGFGLEAKFVLYVVLKRII